MKMPKPTDAEKDSFRNLVPDGPAIEIKNMFGQLAGSVNGNIFIGMFGSAVGVKLNEDDTAALLAIDGAGPFGPEERPMGGYVALPPSWNHKQSTPWVEKALDHVSAMPPKKKKPKKATPKR